MHNHRDSTSHFVNTVLNLWQSNSYHIRNAAKRTIVWGFIWCTCDGVWRFEVVFMTVPLLLLMNTWFFSGCIAYFKQQVYYALCIRQIGWEPLRDIKRGRQNISRIENQWRKIEIFFISLKHPFLWTSFEKNILKFQRSFFRAKCEKVWKFVKIAVFSLPKRLNRHATLERCWQR